MRFRRAAWAFLGEAATFIIGVEIAGIAAVVSGQAGVDLMGSDDHRPGVGPALDHSTDKRRYGQTPLGVHRIERAPLEEVVDLQCPDPLHKTDLPRSRRRVFRAPRDSIASQRSAPKL